VHRLDLTGSPFFVAGFLSTVLRFIRQYRTGLSPAPRFVLHRFVGAWFVSAESPFWILPLVRSPSELSSLYRCFSRSTPARTAFHFLPVAPDSLRRFWLSSPTRRVFIRARNHVPSFLPPAAALPRGPSLLSSYARLVRDSRFSSLQSTRPAFILSLDFPLCVSSLRQECWLCPCLVNRFLRPICLGLSVFARTRSCREVLLSTR
jgi:hypothetical protein